jgi:hypothetical protein
VGPVSARHDRQNMTLKRVPGAGSSGERAEVLLHVAALTVPLGAALTVRLLTTLLPAEPSGTSIGAAADEGLMMSGATDAPR